MTRESAIVSMNINRSPDDSESFALHQQNEPRLLRASSSIGQAADHQCIPDRTGSSALVIMKNAHKSLLIQNIFA